MMSGDKRLKVLFLPGWYPSEVDPVAGIFVQEHAKAASLHEDVVVLYAYGDFSGSLKPYRISEAVESGIRTIRIRYGGLLSYLWIGLRRKEQSQDRSSAQGAKPAGYLARLLEGPKTLMAALFCYPGLLLAYRGLVREGWRPDVIHAHVFLAAVPAVMLGKLHRVPVAITEHSSAFPRRLLTLPLRLQARFAMNRAQIILPVSDDLRRHIGSYGIDNTFVVIPNAVNTDLFRPAPHEAAPGKTGKKHGKKLLLVAGLTPVKGVPCLLEALAQLRQMRSDFSLDIVGDGPNRQDYEQLSANLGLDAAVAFHGQKAKEEVAAFMRNCDFYVQSSLWENLPCVLIEATACGKPVVATNVGGTSEIVDSENGVLVPPDDAKALRDAVEYMLDNYQTYASEIIARHARDRFSYEAVGRMLDEVYRELVRT